MAKISTWSKTAASNNASPPDGWPEGQAPSTVNNCAREMMAQIRTQWENAEWFDYGHTVSNVSAAVFKVTGDVTALYEADRRVKLVDASTLYATIDSSSYSAPDTTVNVTLDSGSITASLASSELAILAASNSSRPRTDLPLADGGTGASLSDPGADRILFWDDSAGAVTWLTTSSDFTISSTTLSLTTPGSWVKLSSQTASSSATIDFDNLLTSTYDVYVVTGNLIRPATNSADLYLRMGTGATPTYQSGATDYTWSNNYASSSGDSFEGSTDDSEIQINGGNGPGNTAGSHALAFTLYVYGPSDSFHTYTANVYTVVRGSDSLTVTGTVGGRFKSTTAATSLRFLFSSGNITAGDFTLYGIAK